MTRNRRWMLAMAAFGVGTATAGPGVRHYHGRPQILCGLPPHDYQPPQPPPLLPPIYAISEVGFVLGPVPTPLPLAAALAPARTPLDVLSLQTRAGIRADQLRVKVFQFTTSSLAMNHCSVSRMVMTIREDGLWRVSLRADQNPRLDPLSLKTAPLVDAQVIGMPNVRIQQTGHLKRNLFVVRLRGLGSFTEPLPAGMALPIVAKPVFLELPELLFWVQSGVPYPLVMQQQDPDVAAYFDRIDRVELEFSYR